MKKWAHLVIICLLLFLAGCTGSAAQQEGRQMDYQQTKKMMIDLLKSDDGKKAIREIMNDKQMKKETLMNQDFVKKTIQDTLTSKQGKAYWKSMLKDPKFANALAKTMAKENKDTLKVLMKDPQYQDLMMDILKSPEMEKHNLDLMKSKAYRKQTQEIMADSLKSPLFQEKLSSILKQVVDEEMDKESQSEGSKQG